MARWEQVGGDVNPKEYGAVLARVEGSSVTVVQIDPGEEEGEGFYVTEGHFDESDLKWGGQAKAERVAASCGVSKLEWEEKLSLADRAQAALAYHGGGWSGDSRHTKKWSDALPAASNSIKWWKR